MNRAIEKIAKITMPFIGSNVDKKTNQASHAWRVVDMEDRYGFRGLPKTTECQRCKIVASSEAANWPCGQAPTPLSLDEYLHILKYKKPKSK